MLTEKNQLFHDLLRNTFREAVEDSGVQVWNNYPQKVTSLHDFEAKIELPKF